MPPQDQPKNQPRHSRWILLALTSGAFAALNGLFAKLYLPPIDSNPNA